MTVETETLILKAIEKLEQKLDKFIETTQKDLTDLKVGQARLEGKVETLAVEVQNVKEDVREIKTELKETKEQLSSEIKEVRTELKDTRNEVSGLYKWVIGLILTLGLGVGTLLLKAFDLFPKA